MTRFQRELSEFWKKHAEEQLEKVWADVADGKITIDAEGVARNCIGRVLMDDLLEQLCMVTDKVNVETTRAAWDAKDKAFIDEYCRNYKEPSVEELAEMRATFGAGAVVVDALTGKKIKL